MNNRNFTVGNVAFTDEGVQIAIPYSENDQIDLSRGKQVTYEDLRPWLVAYCQKRMRSCAEKLQNNIARATQVTREIVMWPEGHFSVPVYKNLEFFVGSKGAKSEFNAGILQQVLRQMYSESYLYKEDCDSEYYDATRKSKLNAQKVYLVLTEIMICNMRDIDLENL